MNKKNKALGEKCFRAISIFYKHTNVYWAHTRNLGANLWLLLGAKSMPFGCMSMARLGAKYAEVGCKSMDTFGCISIPFGCMSMDRLGACMRLLGAKYEATFGCTCLIVGSLPDSR